MALQQMAKACNSVVQREAQATPRHLHLHLTQPLLWIRLRAAMDPAELTLAPTFSLDVAEKSVTLVPDDMMTSVARQDSAAADTQAESVDQRTDPHAVRNRQAWKTRERNPPRRVETTGEAETIEVAEKDVIAEEEGKTSNKAVVPCPKPKAPSALELLQARLQARHRLPLHQSGSVDLRAAMPRPQMAVVEVEEENSEAVEAEVADATMTGTQAAEALVRVKTSWHRKRTTVVSADTKTGLEDSILRKGAGAGGRLSRDGCRVVYFEWKGGESSLPRTKC